MLTITSLVNDYVESHPTRVLDEATLETLFVEAVREYQAWADLSVDNQRWVQNGDVMALVSDQVVVDVDTLIDVSEWGIIKPLAYLYVEKQEALIQEASKNHMHEAFGRSSSEIEQDITTYRNDQLRHCAFSMPVVSI